MTYDQGHDPLNKENRVRNVRRTTVFNSRVQYPILYSEVLQTPERVSMFRSQPVSTLRWVKILKILEDGRGVTGKWDRETLSQLTHLAQKTTIPIPFPRKALPSCPGLERLLKARGSSIPQFL